MRLFLARVLPPLAVLLCWKPFSAVLNILLCVFGWWPGVGHAVDIVNNHLSDKRTKRVITAVDEPKWAGRVFPKEAPKSKPRTSGDKLKRKSALEAELIDDPRVGANGTVFRYRA